ncbi:MAG: hypothetical protein WD512_19715, partial [Candidatus Paceibacterota bacterium]
NKPIESANVSSKDSSADTQDRVRRKKVLKVQKARRSHSSKDSGDHQKSNKPIRRSRHRVKRTDLGLALDKELHGSLVTINEKNVSKGKATEATEDTEDTEAMEATEATEATEDTEESDISENPRNSNKSQSTNPLYVSNTNNLADSGKNPCASACSTSNSSNTVERLLSAPSPPIDHPNTPFSFNSNSSYLHSVSLLSSAPAVPQLSPMYPDLQKKNELANSL